MCDNVVDEASSQISEPPFNVSEECNVTAIENAPDVISGADDPENESLDKFPDERSTDANNPELKCTFNINILTTAGSDSGVEVAAGEYASSGAPEALSCASSLISCGSGCDDSFDILSCKNGDRLEDFKVATGDGTSEGGSESSSITGSGSGRGGILRVPSNKKRVAVTEPCKTHRPKPSTAPRPTQGRAPALATRERARSREKSVPGDKPPPPTGPKPAVPPRARPRAAPDTLALICRESPSVKVKATKTSTARCRTPGSSTSPVTSNATTPKTAPDNILPKMRMTSDSKSAFDKYATLPRRKRESSPEQIVIKKDKNTLVDSLYRNSGIFRKTPNRDRDSPPLKSLPPYPKNKHGCKIRIYHETSVQTALHGIDVEKALAGVGIKEIRTDLVVVKKVSKSVQVDNRNKELERLEAKVKMLTEANSKLQTHCDDQAEKLVAIENRLEEERTDKIAAQEELQRNTQKVLSMLGGESGGCGDSLMLLESQLQTSANIVMKQQEDINKLHNTCRDLQQELNDTYKSYRSLEGHLEELESESSELQEFLQAEKLTLQDALRESEDVVLKLQREITRSRRECRLLVRISEQRRHEMLAARAKLAVNRPSQSTPAALPTLAQRLQVLLQTLITTYNISPDDLEDVIFHNEAFSRSGSSEACSPGSPIQRPQPPTTLPGPPPNFNSSRFSDDENSADLLDSETEPCLMMENVLEDVAVHDTYSHNLVSSGISIMSCPNTVPHNLQEDVPLTCPILNGSNVVENKMLRHENKEDSFSSLHNINTFSADELSPAVPDEKPISDSSYYPDMDTYELLNIGYSEHDSLQNLSQAILQRQQSEAECSMSEDILNQRDIDMYPNTNSVVDQVIMVDNLVTKLLKTLKIIQNDSSGQINKLSKEKLKNISEEIPADEHNAAHAVTEIVHDLNGLLNDTESDTLISKTDDKAECNDSDKWCLKNCTSNNQMNSHPCSVVQQSSPRRSMPSLSECNVGSPQPIDSAA